jgi:Na+/H+-dicarboxylate symporter
MLFAPVGVFALMAVTFAQLPIAAATQLVMVLAAVYLAQAIICLGCGLVIWQSSPGVRAFLRGAGEALLTAFATGSSAATMPVEIAAAQERLGIDRKLVGVVLPLGLAVYKLGSAAYLAAVLVFAANATNLELTPAVLVLLTLLTLAASVITAPVSGGTLAALGLVVGGAGVPMSVVTLAATIPLLGKLNTPVNSLGRLTTAVLFSRLGEKTIQPSGK